MGSSTTKPRSSQFKTKPFFFVSEVAPSWPSRLVALFVAATRDAWSGVLICSWLTGSLVSSGGVGWPWSHKRKRILYIFESVKSFGKIPRTRTYKWGLRFPANFPFNPILDPSTELNRQIQIWDPFADQQPWNCGACIIKIELGIKKRQEVAVFGFHLWLVA